MTASRLRKTFSHMGFEMPQWVFAFIVALGVFLFIPNKAQAVLTNGEVALTELGQYGSGGAVSFLNYGANNGPGTLGFSATANTPSVSGTALDTVNHRLFVSDFTNNRVLVYTLNSSNVITTGVPSYVLGQSDFNSNVAVLTQYGIFHPQGLAYDSAHTLLYVATNYNVLVFNVAPGTISNGENASYVLGQPNFNSQYNGTLSSSVLAAPTSVEYDSVNQRLFVSDGSYVRILVFNVAPGTISNGENASYVLGEPDFTTITTGVTQSIMTESSGLAFDATNERLFAADFSRVLVFDVTPATIANGENASNVLGHTTFTGFGGSNTRSSVDTVGGIAYDSTNALLYVTDSQQNRVQVFNVATGTMANGENASFVLGQSSFTATVAGLSQSGLTNPNGAMYNSGNTSLYVVDGGNNRVLVFNVGSISNNENASSVLGQYDSDNVTSLYTKGGANNGTNAYGFNGPQAIAMDAVNHRLFVADSGNNRVVVYALNTDGTINSTAITYVLGQAGLYTGGASAKTQSGLSDPYGLAYDPTTSLLYVVDNGNNRVVVFNVAPGTIANGENASHVLGQSTYTVKTSGDTQTTLANPSEAALDTVNQLLYVADTGNNRIMVFNVASGTISDGENASYVLGQASYTVKVAGTTQNGLSGPTAVAYNAGMLYVADKTNNRIMVFNVAPGTLASNENASFVLGQSGFTTATASKTRTGLSGPKGVAMDALNNLLYVGDNTYNRVIVYNVAPSSIANGENASYVLGQSNFTTSTAGTTSGTLQAAEDLCFNPGNHYLYVSDTLNNRIMVFDTSVMANGLGGWTE